MIGWLTPGVIALLAFTFMVGVGVGAIGRGMIDRRQTPADLGPPPVRHTDGVQMMSTAYRRVLMGLAVGAFLLGGSANFLTWRNGSADHDHIACNSEYARLDGIARDDRDLAARLASAANLEALHADRKVWRSFRRQIVDPQGTDQERIARFLRTIDGKIASIDAQLASVEATQATRERSPYPDPNACEDGKLDRDEIPKPDPGPVHPLSPSATVRPAT